MQNQAAVTIKNRITKALENLQIGFEGEIMLEHPADPSHGDFACNVALEAYSQLSIEQSVQSENVSYKKFNSPRELGETIAAELRNSNQLATILESIVVAGPGFINFKLSQAFLTTSLEEILSASNLNDLTMENRFTGKKVINEFTDPNPFKELHIGHLYSNTVGEAISRLQEAHGAKVKRVCYQGDVGMHVAKSVWGMRQKLLEMGELKAQLTKLGEQKLSERIHFLGQSYAMGATAFEEDENAAEQIKQINYMTFKSAQDTLVEEGWQPQVNYEEMITESELEYQEIKLLFQTGRAWSLEYFDQMYQRMGMRFDDFFFESVVGEYGLKIVREFTAKGIFKESQGAIIFPGSEYGLHDRVFINSMGLPTYEAKELGLAPEKYRRDPYDFSFIITGNEIDEYFKVLLKALSFTNPELAEKTTHLSHGMVRLPEGKMSSRTGKILTAEWLMDEAKSRVMTKVKQDRDLDVNELSEKVGIGAIKYAFLKSSIGNDIAFSFDESLSFQGKSGPYLQYTYVRCVGVWDKAVSQYPEFVKNSTIAKHIDILINNKVYVSHQLNSEEVDILRNLYKYFEVLSAAAASNSPHLLCKYLYELAASFSSFYAEHTIVPNVDMKGHSHDQSCEDGVCEMMPDGIDAQTAFRLMLTQAVARVTKHGLNILGIQTVERM